MGNGPSANGPCQTESLGIDAFPDVRHLNQAHGLGLPELCHEQRNLLFGVTAQISSLSRRDIQDPAFQSYMPRILHTLRRMKVVVEAMANLDKPCSLMISDIPIQPLLESVLLEVTENSSPRAPSLDLRVDEDARVLRADEFWFRQMLVNLLKNALEATQRRQRPKIDVAVSRPKRNLIKLEVRDNGTGMTRVVARKAFDPSFTTKGSKGNGFGLVVSRKAIERHGGRIEARSKPGRGSVFTVLLPQ